MWLEIIDVSKHYETPPGSGRRTVLRSVSLSLERGETAAIVGPSGSGKTTLLNIVGGLDKPTSGTVIVDGKAMAGLDDETMSRMRNRDIGFVFQLHHLLPQATVLENVLIPAIPAAGRSRVGEAALRRAHRLLERVGLSGHKDHFPAQLSGGERQRTAVVRAFINGPKLVLADEPTGSLDREAAENLARLLVDLNRDEATALIVVTHSLELARLMGKAFVLRDGILERTEIG
jgi:ABC-type lipoprotein export system ATPase subunit